MRFYMLSDLHLGGSGIAEAANRRLIKLCNKIRRELSPDEPVLFIILGDLIHQGDPAAFEAAGHCLDVVIDELHDYTVRFEFLPGNHDLYVGNILFFDQFIAKYSQTCAFDKQSVYSKVYDGVNFIFADSNLSRDHTKSGRLNMEEVRSEIRPNMENLLFCHHALTQDQGGDHDCIENASAISRELVRTGVRFVFHGHTHRADSSVSTEYATEFGCGSLSQDLTDMPGNIPNQFSTGQCLDGKLVCVDRWTDVDDGNGSFSHEILYPDPEQFIDPDQFLKETIPTVPEPYIMRRVLPHENTLEDAFTRAFSDIKEVPLMEAWKQHSKILLLSDAGQGKSTELQYVAHELYDTPYFPVLIPLRDYNGGPISSLLPGQYKNLLPSRQALLFDGYDELTPDCRIPFEKELRSYLLKKPAVRVLISSRSNFCKSETGNASHTFPGFIVYTLQKLLPRDVSAYLSSRGINPKRFYSEAAAAKIEDLLDNPFYVCRLADIFLQESALPCRKDIMEKVISLSFLADDAKFQVSLEEQRYALFQLMERVSLAMQLMRKFSFDDGEEYQRLFTPEQRELVKLSGLLARVGTTWQFTHNNFREYLAARYLSRLPLEQALHYFSDGNAIKPSWYNVLGYLTSLTKGDELGLWLRGHAPTALVKSEPDRVPVALRFEILKKIFDECEEKHLWLQNELYSAAELARFACSPDAVMFLLNQISAPLHFRSQYTAIQILEYFPKLFGKQNAVRDCLVDCCKAYPDTSGSICRQALVALCRLGLATPPIVEDMVCHFSDCSNDYVRLGMYELLLATQSHNKYVKFFLDGVPYIKDNLSGSSDRIGNESFELIEGLKQMSTPESICRVLKWMLSEENALSYEKDEIYSSLSHRAAELYQNGAHDLFGFMMDLCLSALQDCEHTATNCCMAFFEATGQTKRALLSAAEALATDPCLFDEFLSMGRNLFSLVEEAYIADEFPNHELFQEIVKRHVRNELQYARCAQAIREKDGVYLPEWIPPIDYEALRRSSQETYFSILFDQQRARNMLAELLTYTENPQMTVGELTALRIDFGLYSPLLTLQFCMDRYVRADVRAESFFDQVHWEEFIIREAAAVLENKQDLHPTVAQAESLSSLVCKMIDGGAFENALHFENDRITFSSLTRSLVFLAVYLDCPLRIPELLQMTEFPSSWFSHNDFTSKIKYDYLGRKVPSVELNQRIAENLTSGQIGFIFQDHIGYCRDVRCEYAVDAAKDLCINTPGDDSIRYTALRYLYELLGHEYIETDVVPYADTPLLYTIATTYKDVSREVLRKAMEPQYTEKPSLGLQAVLITFNSSIAIKDYVSTVQKNHALPEGDTEYGRGPTAAISTISDPKYLPDLGELVEAVYDPAFQDRDFQGLRNGLMTAFINCSRQNAEETLAELNRHHPGLGSAERNVFFYNYMVEEILRTQRLDRDQPWPIEEVESFLRESCRST